MQEDLSGFYRPTDEEFQEMWRRALFTFDANVLLGLYRRPKTEKLFLRILTELQDRIWLSHQAAYEYQRGRRKTIRDQRKKYDEVGKALDDSVKGLRRTLQQLEQRHAYIEPKPIIQLISAAVDKAKARISKLKEKHPDLEEKDSIRARLDQLFKGKIGPPYSGDARERALVEATLRLERRIPPGFADEAKEGIGPLGDILLWMEVLDKVEAEKRPLILVTDDRKEDWWEKDGKTTLGPRPELLQEIYERAGVSSHIYDGSNFMTQAQEFLGLGTQAEAEAAAEEVERTQTEPDRPFTLNDLLDQIRRLTVERSIAEHDDFAYWEGQYWPRRRDTVRKLTPEDYQRFRTILDFLASREQSLEEGSGDGDDEAGAKEDEPPDEG